MLIKALCEYAEKRLEKTAPEGWQEQSISYRVVLNAEGEMVDIKDVRTETVETLKNGKEVKRLKPEVIIVPERIQTTGIAGNLLDHRPLYVFGLNYENGCFNPNDKTDRARKSQESFMKCNMEFFKDISSPACEAFCKFLMKWEPKNQTDNPILLKLGKEFKPAAYFGFCLDTGERLEEDPLFKSAYNAFYEKKKAKSSTGEKMVCGVYGEKIETARIHDKIKFPGGLSSGCALISFNEDAFNSYGKTQSYNANISEKAMKQYTFAMNQLLSDRNHYKIIDDLVIIYFAMKADDTAECKAFTEFLDSPSQYETKTKPKKGKKDKKSEETEDSIDNVIGTATEGALVNVTEQDLDEDIKFYVVGMTPNSSRICVKFFWEGRFGDIVENLKKFQEDMRIGNRTSNIYFSQIKKELVSPNSTVEKVAPSLMSSIATSAFQGTPYPNGLLAAVIKRVKLDCDGGDNRFIKLNTVRAGLIKACLNRNYGKEKIEMAFNEANHNPAYLCGALFSVYEEIQKKSSTTKLNKTIKDAYFSSAMCRPNTIMPKIEQLSQHHMRKLRDDPIGSYLAKMQRRLMSNLDGKFPATLTLDEQGQFIIGYYQMNDYLYMSKDEKEKIKNDTENETV